MCGGFLRDLCHDGVIAQKIVKFLTEKQPTPPNFTGIVSRGSVSGSLLTSYVDVNKFTFLEDVKDRFSCQNLFKMSHFSLTDEMKCFSVWLLL